MQGAQRRLCALLSRFPYRGGKKVVIMPRNCSICAREEVEQINRDIALGVSFERLHEKYGASVGALHRHKTHMMTQLVTAQGVDVSDPSSVMQRIQELEQRADSLYKAAVKKGDLLNTGRALKELREITALYARLTGELNTQQQVIHQHLHVTPEWVFLRSVMLKALAPYPEARTALVTALEGAQALTEGDDHAQR